MMLSSLIVLKKTLSNPIHGFFTSWKANLHSSHLSWAGVPLCSVVLMKNDGKNAGDRVSLTSNQSNLRMSYLILISTYVCVFFCKYQRERC